MRRSLFPVLFVVLVAAAPARAEGPTLAVEDTMHTAVPEVLVRAPRVTLDEILDRVARGERRRDSLITDQSYLATVRFVGHAADQKREPVLLAESVMRVYKKRPDHVRVVRLRHFEAMSDKDKDSDKKKDDDMDVEFGSDMSEEIVNFAFRPENRRDYRFHIAGRDLVGNHVVYRIAFEPRSNLGAEAPSGLVWIDTNEFVIVREELRFARSPIPLVIRDLERMVIERTQVGPHWVLRRAVARIRTTVPLPKIGGSFDFVIAIDDYAINRGIEDAFFDAAKTGRP
jgi:hypothetical protein